MTLLPRDSCCVLREPNTRPATRNTHHASPNPHLLFIAYGNTLRRDDGAGLALAEKLLPLLRNQGLQIELITIQQLTPELALDIANPKLDGVCFFDTATEPHPQAIQVQRVGSSEGTPVLGHHLIPSALLLYAKQLFGVCPPTWLVTIPGYDFALGEGFSPATASYLVNVAPLAQTLAQLPTQVDRL